MDRDELLSPEKDFTDTTPVTTSIQVQYLIVTSFEMFDKNYKIFIINAFDDISPQFLCLVNV